MNRVIGYCGKKEIMAKIGCMDVEKRKINRYMIEGQIEEMEVVVCRH